MENSRRMIYPYTFTAKLLQFPFKYYYNNNPYFKYYVWSLIILSPVFYKIQKASYSPGNVAKREARKKKEHEEALNHYKHQL